MIYSLSGLPRSISHAFLSTRAQPEPPCVPTDQYQLRSLLGVLNSTVPPVRTAVAVIILSEGSVLNRDDFRVRPLASQLSPLWSRWVANTLNRDDLSDTWGWALMYWKTALTRIADVEYLELRLDHQLILNLSGTGIKVLP